MNNDDNDEWMIVHTDLKASDGYLVHGVIDRLDDVQHGG